MLFRAQLMVYVLPCHPHLILVALILPRWSIEIFLNTDLSFAMYVTAVREGNGLTIGMGRQMDISFISGPSTKMGKFG